MSINIIDLYEKHSFEKNFFEKIKNLINKIILNENFDFFDVELNIIFVKSSFMKKINKKYRHKDKDTDVLSFKYDEKNFEIFLSLNYIYKQNNFKNYLIFSIIHGLLHILGYEHETDDQFLFMNEKEKKYRELIC